MKRKLIDTALIAAAAAAASWAVRSLLAARSDSLKAPRKPPLEDWENEGGALAPHHLAIETSQVPR